LRRRAMGSMAEEAVMEWWVVGVTEWWLCGRERLELGGMGLGDGP
jgi:hypothetical protein